MVKNLSKKTTIYRFAFLLLVFLPLALSVRNLDAWIAKLRSEGVRFLDQPYKVGGTRAVMIEGPSHEAIEVIEVQ